jgi:hypothetical protein
MSSKACKFSNIKLKEDRILLGRLEAGLKTQLPNGKDINDVYQEKLNNVIDTTEPITYTKQRIQKENPLGRPKSEPKPKPKKTLSKKGETALNNLSKYRQQVKEALALKKDLETKLTYDDDDDDEYDDESVVPDPVVPEPVAQQPMPDLNSIYNQIDELKKQNQELERRFIQKNDLLNVGNLRRNMMLKF